MDKASDFGSGDCGFESHLPQTHFDQLSFCPGRLAQSVERTSNKRTVGGSSPPVTIYPHMNLFPPH